LIHMPNNSSTSASIAVVGAGPAGLMAAETLANHGWAVDVYDGMPSVGRKFLLAGVGGMNITHSEPAGDFLERYREHRAFVQPWLQAFDSERLRRWVHELGIGTFIGSSGRVFPREMKAAPLLRAWLQRLRRSGVRIHVRHRWLGWDADGALRFRVGQRGDRESQDVRVEPRALVLALGGGSWSRLGSDGAWVPLLQRKGVAITSLTPANCGFEVNWTAHFRDRFAGHPLKPVRIRHCTPTGNGEQRLGECMVSREGLEGGVIYALSSPLREGLENDGQARIELDLAPDQSLDRLTRELAKPRGSRSMASHLRRRARIEGVKAGLLREVAGPEAWQEPARLAQLIKALPLSLTATRPLDEAISTAGGVPEAALDKWLMLKALSGVFCAGEMLDWEAPTGGYLLNACFASGFAAGNGVHDWLQST
jgi:uncharacterized flavoprotein (TIGR03862 family)